MDLNNLKTGIIISLLIILYGFSLGIIFGAFEDDIKDSYHARAEQVLDQKYDGDVALMEKTVGKAWEFLKHAHTHALGLGPISLVLILLMGFLKMKAKIKFFTSLALSIGALGYPIYWQVASYLAPVSGNHEQTKESLALIAQPAAGLCFLALVVIVWYAFKTLPCRNKTNC